MGSCLTSVRPRVAGPAVADHRAAGDHVASDEAGEGGGRIVLDHRKARPARPLADDLDRAGEQQLALVRTAGLGGDRVVLGAQGDTGVSSTSTRPAKRRPLRVDHGTAQLGQQQPSRLVGAQAQLQPQLAGGDAVPVGRHQPRRREPQLERQVAAMQHRARGHRGLPVAPGALDQHHAAAQFATVVMATSGAAKALRPPLRQQPAGARLIIGKPRLEFSQRPTENRPSTVSSCHRSHTTSRDA